MIIRPKHISVRNPQAPGPRSRSALCSRRRRYDARIPPIFADHLRSSVLCIQCRQARGGIPLVAISVRACMPGQRIFTSRNGVLVSFFLFRPHRGVSGKHRSRLVPLEPSSVRACPRRTKPAPIYSAQFPPSVRKRTKVGRELRDPTLWHWQLWVLLSTLTFKATDAPLVSVEGISTVITPGPGLQPEMITEGAPCATGILAPYW